MEASTSLHVVGNVIMSNTASVAGYAGAGGGIYLGSNNQGVSVIGNRIEHNRAALVADVSAGGGGIHCSRSANVTIGQNVIRYNAGNLTDAGSGGGIELYACDSVTVFNNLLQDNIGSEVGANSRGGAIMAAGGRGLTIDANRILSNTAVHGGAICTRGDVAFTMTNNIVTANEAEHGGGIAFWIDGSADSVTGTLVNNTFVANDRGSGNGRVAIYVGDPYSSGILNASLVLTNNLIYSHTYGVYVGPDSDVALYNTLFYANSSGDTAGPGSITNAAPVTGQDPLLDGDYHLQAGSPAVNRGISVPWLSVDIDGDPRPDWCFYDIGVDETVTGLGCQYVYVPLVQR